jgi:hypothetical protein
VLDCGIVYILLFIEHNGDVSPENDLSEVDWQNDQCLGCCFFPYGIVERIVGRNEMSVRRVQERREALQFAHIGQS